MMADDRIEESQVRLHSDRWSEFFYDSSLKSPARKCSQTRAFFDWQATFGSCGIPG